ncbi:uncharacterized protein LOC144702462 [Wolffia australiana]
MELDEHAFLNELLALRRDPWDISFSSLLGGDHLAAQSYEGGVCFDCSLEEPAPAYLGAGVGFASPPAAVAAAYAGAGEPPGPSFDCFDPSLFMGPVPAFPTAVGPDVHSSCSTSTTSTAGGVLYPLNLARDDCSRDLEAEDLSPLIRGGVLSPVVTHEPAVRRLVERPKHALTAGAYAATGLDVGSSPTGSQAGNPRCKRIDGQPSKNLMAERRRRKRLNDRLSMLRSIVPKISKMDRTSILGDTIDYMRELLDRIQALRGEVAAQGEGASSKDSPAAAGRLLRTLEDRLGGDEALVRNSPKFNVEKREKETRVEMSCGARAGLLLSTVNTLQSLGLDIQQCVVSCFNDFGMRATCSEDVKQGELISTEEIKQALFRNAGYGGRCA